MNKEQYFKARAKINYTKLNIHWVMDYSLTLLLATAAFSTWMINPTPAPFKVLSPFLLAISMYRAFALFHEGTHRQLHNNQNINDGLAILISPLCLLPFEPWRVSHMQHHTWSGNIDKDPVMGFINVYPKLNPKVKMVLNFGWKNWLPVLACVQHLVFWSLSIKSYQKSDKNFKMKASLIYPITVWLTALTLAPAQLMLFCFLPALVIYMIGTEIINLPHHLQLETKSGEKKYPLWEQHHTARSCQYPHIISQYIVLNFNYHVEHHLFPDAPWRQLNAIQILTKNLVQDDYNSDPQFAWITQARKYSLDEVLKRSDSRSNSTDTESFMATSDHSA